MNERRYLITLAFDGSDFEGWQARPTARSVRSELARACENLWGHLPEMVSSSRTDAGVHARAMVVQLSMPADRATVPLARITLALNAHLPADLRVLRCREPKKPIHARFDATAKEYRYEIYLGAIMPPTRARYAWQVQTPLDLDAMNQAAQLLVGHHDFRAFTVKRKGTLGSSTRHLFACDLQLRGKSLIIRLHGDGFLYKMCRKIVGTLVQIGQGKFAPSIIPAMLTQTPSPAPHLVAPAQGLTLWRVHYKESKSLKVGRSKVESQEN